MVTWTAVSLMLFGAGLGILFMNGCYIAGFLISARLAPKTTTQHETG